MKYEGYMVGPALRKLREDRGLSIMQACNLTGMSPSSINQMEQGGRNMSMKSLFLFMEAYQTDANTVLDIRPENSSIDSKLASLPEGQREYLMSTFLFMLEKAERMSA
ncbi:MAG: helix-turn-helix transcriptional regulator [Oscillospiraceae bacterium]|nr:helix-turn-helix transcriptional regulator [Oscillospiraceae bacterium]